MFLYFWMFIQIVIESLPISSSGHVILAQKFLEIEFLELMQQQMIDFILHIPTIAIIVIFFFKSWYRLFFQEQSISFRNVFRKQSFVALLRPGLFVFAVCCITALFWVVDFAHVLWIEQHFLTFGFAITGLMLYCGALFKSSTEQKSSTAIWSCCNVLLLGVAQGMSFLPGISRFATTYTVGWLLCGYTRPVSFALSFLIELPLLLAAGVKGSFGLMHHSELLTKMVAFPGVFVILIASFISYKILSFVKYLIMENKLYYLAWYMVIPIIISCVMN